MITYSTTWMGPAGRIDIRDDSKEGYDGWDEYGLAPMHGEDWDTLSNWLCDLQTTEQWGYEMLISIFEGEVLNGREIRWATDRWVKCYNCSTINGHTENCTEPRLEK